MFLLQCPKCKNRMKYQGKGVSLSGKKKKCVYCGFSIVIERAIIKKVYGYFPYGNLLYRK